MEKIETKDSKRLKKTDYKPVILEASKTILYAFITGAALAAGGHAYASVMKTQKGKLISINGGKQSMAM